MAKVFLSYAPQDQTIARQIVVDLKRLGVDLWSDINLRAEDSWREIIGETLRQVEAVVVLVSPASITSDWVTDEWAAALLGSKRVIPALVGGATFWHLPAALQEIQAVDFNVSYGTGIRQLADVLGEVATSSDPKPGELVNIDELAEEAALRILERLGFDTLTSDARPQVRSNAIFVVMSFESNMDPTFEAIRAAAERIDMVAERIKDVKADFLITETILRKIDSARIVVVDLTLERPNVYFELGYARGKGKTVVTLLKVGAKAHVDVRGWNYIEYIDSRPLEEDLVTRFTAEIQSEGRADKVG